MVISFFGINIYIRRSDNSKILLLKAVNTGPADADTPYGGMFEFDIYFPPGYPRCPPKVKFRTTGASSVRFNPTCTTRGRSVQRSLVAKYFLL